MGAGGAPKYRHLSRTSSHRQALLRNLVTSLFTHESITTTWHKAKEAQRVAEKLITLGKRNTDAARRRAESVFFTPHALLPKLFTTLRTRYAARPGGYTRVLRLEPRANDQAPTALLELLDGPRDMRFAITAQTLARQRALKLGKSTSITQANVRKVTRFREGGVRELEKAVDGFRRLQGLGVGVGNEGEGGLQGGIGIDGGGGEGKKGGMVVPLRAKRERYGHTRRPSLLYGSERER